MRRTALSLTFIALASLLATSVHAQLRIRSHYAVSQSEVARAIEKALIHDNSSVSLSQVLLQTDVVATEPSPSLDVTGVSALPRRVASHADERQLAVRLACHTAGACLPFYAVVDWPADELAAIPTALQHGSLSGTDLKVPAQPRPQIILRSGTHATLVLEDGSSRVAVPVIILQDGAEGQSIRVSSLDRKHTYIAQAVSATLLRGSF